MDLDDEEYYYNKFIKTHISKKELKEKYISKDKIREYYYKICASVNHFQSKNDNNIVLRVKEMLEDLLKE